MMVLYTRRVREKYRKKRLKHRWDFVQFSAEEEDYILKIGQRINSLNYTIDPI